LFAESFPLSPTPCWDRFFVEPGCEGTAFICFVFVGVFPNVLTFLVLDDSRVPCLRLLGCEAPLEGGIGDLLRRDVAEMDLSSRAGVLGRELLLDLEPEALGIGGRASDAGSGFWFPFFRAVLVSVEAIFVKGD
jgi:hypothetical protein